MNASSSAQTPTPPERTRPQEDATSLAGRPDDGMFRVYYAQVHLDYTMRTNQTNEARMTKLLTVSIGALAAVGLLLEQLDHGTLEGTAYDYLLLGTLLGALLLLAGIFVLVRGITPVIEDKESVMLNDYIAARPVGNYVREVAGHGPVQAQEAILRENAAMASVVLSRQHAYLRSRALFYFGGGLVILVFFLNAILHAGSSGGG